MQLITTFHFRHKKAHDDDAESKPDLLLDGQFIMDVHEILQHPAPKDSESKAEKCMSELLNKIISGENSCWVVPFFLRVCWRNYISTRRPADLADHVKSAMIAVEVCSEMGKN